jgi:hypothetical protein
MVVKYANIFHSNSPPKYIQFGIFGIEINHLATLFKTQKSDKKRELEFSTDFTGMTGRELLQLL